MTEPFKESAAWIVQNQPELAAEIARLMQPAVSAITPVVPLTRRQQDTLNFIRGFSIKNRGIAPTYDEIKDGIGLTSKSGIARLVDGLVERGCIRRLPNRARAIVVIDQVAA